jgi:hypothetical protein
MLSAQEISNRSTDWVLLVLGLIALLIVLAKLQQAERTTFFLKLPFQVQAKEWAINFNPIQSKKVSDALLSLSSILTMALVCLIISRFWQGEQSLAKDFIAYLKMVFVLIGVFLGKTLLGSLVAAVFDVQDNMAATQNISIAFFAWIQVPLLPIVIVGTFLSWQTIFFAQLLLGMALLGLLYSLWLTAKASLRIGPILSYNIFYLCTLEIIPVLFLVFLLQKI